MKSFIIFISIIFIKTVSFGAPPLTSLEKAKRLFERLTGVPILVEDPRLKQMADLIEKGQDESASAIATQDPYFYQITVKNMAAAMSNKSETPYVGLDDFQVTFMGAVRDDLDARSLLTGNYLYRMKTGEEPSRRNNHHYEIIDNTADKFGDNSLTGKPPAGLV